jgi:hypothetical protein
VVEEAAPPPASPSAKQAPVGKKRAFLRRWGLRVLALAVAFFAGVFVTIFSIDLGPRLVGLAEREGSKYLERPLHIGAIRAFVGVGDFELTNVVIEGLKPADRPFLNAQTIRVKVPWWTVFRRDLIIESIRMANWQATIESWPGDVNNLPRFKPRKSSGRPLPFKVTTREIIAEGGAFSYEDHAAPWSVEGHRVSVNVARTLGAYYGRMSFSGGTIKVQSYLPMGASMEAGFKMDGSLMRLHRINLKTDGAATDLTGVVDFARFPEQTYTVASRMAFPEMRRIFFDGSHFELEGNGRFDGTFHKFKDGFEVKGKIASPLFVVDTSFGNYHFPNIDGHVDWRSKRLEVTDLVSDFYGGRARQAYTLAPLGSPNAVATWDVAYENVDLTAFGGGLEWPVLRLDGRATGRNFMKWTNGRFGATKVGDGEISSVSPDGSPMAAAVLPAHPVIVPPDRPFDIKKRLSPYKLAGNIKYKWSPEFIEVDDGAWMATPHTHLAFKGRTAYGDRSNMPFQLTSTDWQESDRLLVEVMAAFNSIAKPVEVGGYGTFAGVLTKAFWNPRIEGTFSGDHLRAWDVDWGRGTGQAVIENSYADLTNAVFVRGNGPTVGPVHAAFAPTLTPALNPPARIETTGRYSLGYPRADRGQELQARINISNWPLVDFRHMYLMDDWPFDGLGTAELHLYGGFDRPEGFGRLQIDQGIGWGETFDTATGSLRFEYAGVRVDGIELAKSTGFVRGAAFSDWHSGTYSFNFDGQRIPVRSLVTFAMPNMPLGGLLNFNATGAGDVLKPDYEVRANITDLTAGDVPVGQMVARLRVQDETLMIEQLEAASSELSASGSGRIALNEASDADLTFRFTNTAVDPYLRMLSPKIAESISPHATAVLSGSVRVFGELADYRYLGVDATIDKAELKFFDFPLRNDGPVHITFGENIVHIGRLRLTGEDTQLELSGDVSLADEQVNLRATGGANLAILQAFSRDLRSSGAAEITADIRGDMAAPQFSGRATLSGGRVRHFAMPHSFEEINGNVTFDSDGVRLDGLRGRLGGGDVQFGGTIGLRGYLPDELNITASGRNMTLRYPEGFQSRVNADLALRGNRAAQVLSGTVNVLHATMTKELDSEAGLFGLAAAEAAAASIAPTPVETGLPLSYEVQVIAPQTLRIDSSLARIVASADLTFRGTYDHPSLTGRIDINRGEATFQGNRFIVNRGAIEFFNPQVIEPIFDIEMETNIRVPGQNYRVNVQVSGTTQQITPTLSSNPVLPQLDIVSLLFGETNINNLRDAELRARDTGQQATMNLIQASAARLITSPLSSQVGKVMERTLGVDTVQITPLGLNATSFDPKARVTLGKRVSDRVYITYSRALGNGQTEVILLEYDQNQRLSWVLSKNENQTFALDFRVRHIF